MIGRPGCGVLQMNGQPTAQNTRECGADGEFPAFRNWENPDHIAELARLWNVEPAIDPALGAADARDADLPLRRDRARSSSSGSSPPTRPSRCPSCTASARSSRKPGLFVVVQDAFLTETAELADVVLPGGDLGREDRHASPTPTAPSTSRTRPSSRPARRGPTSTSSSTYARRMDFRDKDGGPLIKWTDAGGGVRGLEGVHPRPALRLQRPELREAHRRLGHPVAVQRAAPRRLRAALRRRRLPDRADDVRDLRPRPRHRGRGRPGRVPGERPGRARPCSSRPTTSRRTRSRTTTTRSG